MTGKRVESETYLRKMNSELKTMNFFYNSNVGDRSSITAPHTHTHTLEICWLHILFLLQSPVPSNPKAALLDRDLVTVEVI